MRLLVIGGSGFTGTRVIEAAIAAGIEPVVMVRSDRAAEIVRGLGGRAVRGNLDDSESVTRTFELEPDVLLTVASLGFGHAPVIVRAAENAGVRRAVFVSTTGVTTTLSPASKKVRLAAEDTIKSSTLEWTIVRPTMIYGEPGDRNVSRMLALLRRTPLVPLPGGGRRLHQPVHVRDLAALLVNACHTPAAQRRMYNAAGPEAITLRQLIDEAAAAVGRTARPIPLPVRPTVLAVRAYERLAAHPRLKAEQIERLAEDKAFSIEDARRDLAFAPRTFRHGVTSEARLLFPQLRHDTGTAS